MIEPKLAVLRHLWVQLLIGLCLILLLEQGLEFFINQVRQQDEQVKVLNHLFQVRSRLEAVVNSNLLALRGLMAVLAVHPDMQQAEFTRIAGELVENHAALRNVAAAPGLVVSLIYPLEGNAAAIGLNYRTDPAQKKLAARAVASESMVLAGPLEWGPGGLGIVAMAPVFIPGGEGGEPRRLWGLVSSVLDYAVVLQKSGLEAGEMPIRIAVRGRDGSGAEGKVFFGDTAIFEHAPVLLDLTLPFGTWQMAGVPNEGWWGFSPLLWVTRIGAGLLSLMSALILYMRKRNNLLQARSAQDLATSEAMLAALVDGSSDIIFVKDTASRYLRVNRSLARLVGKPIEKIVGADDFMLFPEPLARQLRADDQRIMQAGQVESYEETVVTPEGAIPLLTIKGPLLINGKIQGVFGTARDISQLKQAEERIKQALAETQQREAELEAVFQALPDLFFRMAADGTILEYRARRAADLYVPPERFLGKRMQDVIPGQLAELFVAKLQDVLEQGQIVTYEYDMEMPDGEHRYEARLILLGEGDQVIAVIRDVSEQHRARLALRESERRLATLMSNLPGMAYRARLDDRYTIEFVSDGCKALTGYAPDALIDNRELAFADLVDPEDVKRIGKQVHRAVDNGGSFELVYRVKHRDGQLRWFWEKGQNVSRNANGGTILEGFITDITELKRAEAKLQEAHDELEQRVDERTTELTLANRELEAFTSSVSHDLRAPIRSISGFARILMEEYGWVLDEQGRFYLDQVISGGQRMRELVEGLLRLSRSTWGELVRMKLNLSGLVEEVVEELHRAEPERRVDIEIQPGLTARGDPRLLRTLLQNLIGNAWKYTANCPTPSIRISGEYTDGVWCYCVEDNGAGFNMDYVDKIFTPFYRLHRQDEFTGIGIGLATAQRIVKRHGGEISAWGKVDQGARFCFTLGKEISS